MSDQAVPTPMDELNQPAPPSQATQRMTPSNVPNNRQEMKPLPLRVASKQYERLCQARDRSGISIQEHIRRSIDIYLVQIEREAIELGQMQAPRSGPKQASDPVRAPRSETRSASPKVVKR